MTETAFTKNYLTPLLHIGSWSLVFLWPLLTLQDTGGLNRIILRNWLPTFCILLVFYANYWILVDQFFFKKKRVLFFVLNALLIIGAIFLIKLITPMFSIENPARNFERARRIGKDAIFPNIQFILPMVLSIGMCLGLKINAQWRKKELLLERVKQSQLNSEIKYLRHQIQPHFLFNTLNNIYSLIDSAPITAKESIHSLSKMMRYLLHESTADRVPLSKEIEFLERYIDLMQLRVSDNLTLEKNFPEIDRPIQIAPLLLISFVENAFKHGIDAVQPSFIEIILIIENNTIHYVVQNTSFPEKGSVTDSGIGLSNLRKRLNLLYPGKFELSEKEDNGMHVAELIIDYSE